MESFRPIADSEGTYGFEISASSETGEIADAIPMIVEHFEETQRRLDLFLLVLYIAIASILFIKLLLQLLSLLRVIWPMQKNQKRGLYLTPIRSRNCPIFLYEYGSNESEIV